MSDYRKEGANGVVSTDLCADPDLWHSADYASTEAEVSQLIGGLVRGLQPDVSIELGAWHGETTRWIATALVANGHGLHYAVDTDTEALRLVGDKTMGMPVRLVNANAEMWVPPALIDFLFVDHGPVTGRCLALSRMASWLSDRAVIVVHDTGTHWQLWPAVRTLAQQRQWWYMPLPTPRGLTLLRPMRARDGRALLP